MVIENDLKKYVKKHTDSNNKVDYYSLYNEIDYIDPNCHLNKYIDHFEKNGGGKKWLDIGCNIGLGLEKIKQRNYDEYGFDVVEKSISIAKSKNLKAIVHSAIEKFPYEDNFFDIVSATDVLEHFTKPDIDICMDEIKRVLKHDGVCLLASCTHDDQHHVHITIQNIKDWEKYYNSKGFITTKIVNPYGIFLLNKKNNNE